MRRNAEGGNKHLRQFSLPWYSGANDSTVTGTTVLCQRHAGGRRGCSQALRQATERGLLQPGLEILDDCAAGEVPPCAGPLGAPLPGPEVEGHQGAVARVPAHKWTVLKDSGVFSSTITALQREARCGATITLCCLLLGTCRKPLKPPDYG